MCSVYLKPNVVRLRVSRQDVDHATVGNLFRGVGGLDVGQEVTENLLASEIKCFLQIVKRFKVRRKK